MRTYTKRIEFWQTTPVTDAYGGATVSEALVATSWAEVKTVSNSGQLSARATELGVTDINNSIIVKTSYRNDIDYNATNMYVKYRGVKYVIQTVPNNADFNDVQIQFIATKHG